MLYSLAKVVLEIFVAIFFKVEVVGNNHIPDGKPFIIACNHTSNFDAVMVMAKTKNRKIHFLAKKELFSNKFIGALLERSYAIPIDREKNDLRAIKRCLKVLKQNEVLGIFPEGTRVKNGEDEEAKLGIGMFAVMTNTPVIPVSICAQKGYRIFSKISITYHEPYHVPAAITQNKDKTRRNDGFRQVADDVMNIIRKGQR